MTDTYLAEMISIARAAGQVALTYRKQVTTMEVGFKGQADLICEADSAVETSIKSQLSAISADIAYQGEELGKSGPMNAEMSWLVDPIDGTTNFLSGLPFVISIALVRGDDPISGVIYDPLVDEMYAATKGGGAHLNGKPIRVREQPDVARLVVGTGLPLDAHVHSRGAYDRLHDIREAVAAVRIVGTCALSLAYVASARLDGYFEGPTGFIDCAAGHLLVTEAGGVVSDYWGEPNQSTNWMTIAGAPACHAFLQRATSKAPR